MYPKMINDRLMSFDISDIVGVWQWDWDREKLYQVNNNLTVFVYYYIEMNENREERKVLSFKTNPSSIQLG